MMRMSFLGVAIASTLALAGCGGLSDSDRAIAEQAQRDAAAAKASAAAARQSADAARASEAATRQQAGAAPMESRPAQDGFRSAQRK